MNERERLIKLLREAEAKCTNTGQCRLCEQYGKGGDCQRELIADCLLANGVLCPPCKVGDTVYQTDSCRVYESEIDYIEVHGFVTIFYADGVAFDERAIGESIFLSRELAEKALAERSNR
jgi:hypothetical protein